MELCSQFIGLAVPKWLGGAWSFCGQVPFFLFHTWLIIRNMSGPDLPSSSGFYALWTCAPGCSFNSKRVKSMRVANIESQSHLTKFFGRIDSRGRLSSSVPPSPEATRSASALHFAGFEEVSEPICQFELQFEYDLRPYDNPYDVGIYQNICAVLGGSPLVWQLARVT